MRSLTYTLLQELPTKLINKMLHVQTRSRIEQIAIDLVRPAHGYVTYDWALSHNAITFAVFRAAIGYSSECPP